MDKDTLKGKMDDIKGRVKREAGKWTGDEDLEAEGVTDQAKGKTESAWGKVKDKAREIADDVRSGKDRMKSDLSRKSEDAKEEADRVIDRKRDAA